MQFYIVDNFTHMYVLLNNCLIIKQIFNEITIS
jgi:hypothetical protein